MEGYERVKSGQDSLDNETMKVNLRLVQKRNLLYFVREFQNKMTLRLTVITLVVLLLIWGMVTTICNQMMKRAYVCNHFQSYLDVVHRPICGKYFYFEFIVIVYLYTI